MVLYKCSLLMNNALLKIELNIKQNGKFCIIPFGSCENYNHCYWLFTCNYVHHRSAACFISVLFTI